MRSHAGFERKRPLLYWQYRQKRLFNKIITQKNEEIRHLLAEKKWLLKELHHRVKNNLHTVICLLESQAVYLQNDALKAIENTQRRIYAMSLIHQKSYQSEDIKTIDVDTYLPEFIQYLHDSFGNMQQIRFRLEIPPLKLNVSQAIPVALIINEALTNSFKYAFPGQRPGEIFIGMGYTDQGIQLVIADNGIGIQVDPGAGEPNSLGLELIKGLSEDLKAKISFDNQNGTRITIVFNVDPLIPA